jgi:hypothetical protein
LLVSSLQEQNIGTVVATLVEGANVKFDVELEYSLGEGKFFITLYYKRILGVENESYNFCFIPHVNI